MASENLDANSQGSNEFDRHTSSTFVQNETAEDVSAAVRRPGLQNISDVSSRKCSASIISIAHKLQKKSREVWMALFDEASKFVFEHELFHRDTKMSYAQDMYKITLTSM